MMGNRGFGSGFNDMMNGGWGGVLWLLFGALVIAGVVLLVLWAMRASTGRSAGSVGPTPPPQASGHDEAVAIARRRLASGEITKEEYDQIVSALGG